MYAYLWIEPLLRYAVKLIFLSADLNEGIVSLKCMQIEQGF